jgi:hypothetical protein
MCRFAFVLLLLLSSVRSAIGGDYFGNRILEILGEEKNGEAVSQFTAQFSLDRALRNSAMGIRLTTDHDSVSVVNSIVIANANLELNDYKYKQFAGVLPYNISLNDDAEALTQKLGACKTAQELKMKFKKDGITINVFFKTSAKKKISYIKFTQNIGMFGPYRIDGRHEMPVMIVSTSEAVAIPARDAAHTATGTKYAEKSNNRSMAALPSAAEFGKSTSTTVRTSQDPFYAAIMNVIESGEEEMFKDIKQSAMPKTNFWNYKYTFSTNVSIPGEKYNMLYSFPFQSSQLDFVSVLDESDGDSPAMKDKYTEMEAKLKSYFKSSEGWTYHYTVNAEDPKGIKDLELKNSKLGSIVLDYSINPYGKHVLYLRFLLQYT